MEELKVNNSEFINTAIMGWAKRGAEVSVAVNPRAVIAYLTYNGKRYDCSAQTFLEVIGKVEKIITSA